MHLLHRLAGLHCVHHAVEAAQSGWQHALLVGAIHLISGRLA